MIGAPLADGAGFAFPFVEMLVPAPRTCAVSYDTLAGFKPVFTRTGRAVGMALAFVMTTMA